MKVLLLFILSIVGHSIFAQTGYNVPEKKISFEKDVTFGTVHGYLEIESDTNDTLPMFWVARKDVDFPIEWVVNFDDQSSYYPVINSGDQDSFNLNPIGSFTRKLIIGLAHNGIADTASIFFSLHPQENPNDSVVIEYQFKIARKKGEEIDTTTGITRPINNLVKIDLNRAENWTISTSRSVDAIHMYDIRGNLIAKNLNSNTLIANNNIRESIIIIRVEQNDEIYTKKFHLSQ